MTSPSEKKTFDHQNLIGKNLFDSEVFNETDIFSHNRHHKTVHWSVSWSDLMMIMFIFFAVMYIYQSAKRDFLPKDSMIGEIGSSIGNDATTGMVDGGLRDFSRFMEQSISKIYEQSLQTIKTQDLGSLASVDLDSEKAVRIILTGDLLFDTGKADLKPRAVRILREIGMIVRKTPYAINVVGHTDNVPIHSDRFPTNWELSVIRACVVSRFLIEQTKLRGHRFFISGHSYHQPLEPNSTAENRAKNRRVEIIISKEIPVGTFDG